MGETYGTHLIPGETCPTCLERMRVLGSADPTIRLNTEPAALPANVAPTPRMDTVASNWKDPSRWVATRSDPLGPGSVIKDRFVLESEIGRGGMGRVFKARDLRKVEAEDADPYVAIKILNEQFRRHPLALSCLQAEARKSQHIAHPNIVTVYDFDRDGTDVYLVMELLEGEPLDRILKRGIGVGRDEALRIMQDMCRALSHAHGQGVVHADLKPSNVFVTRSGVVKIFDFGIARAVKGGDQAGGFFTPFDPHLLGAVTPAYAGYEVMEGETPDARDDLYAIACIAYEMLTGRHPFKRMSGAVAFKANVEVSRPANLSHRQWQALRRALAFQRGGRQESIAQFIEEFMRSRRSPALYVGATAAVAALATALVLMNVQTRMSANRSASSAPANVDAPARDFAPQPNEIGAPPMVSGPAAASAALDAPGVPMDVAPEPVESSSPASALTERRLAEAVALADRVVTPGDEAQRTYELESAPVFKPAPEPAVAEPTLASVPGPSLAQSPVFEQEASPEQLLSLAAIAISDGRIEEALRLAGHASELAPASPQITAIQRRYARYVALGDQLNRRDSFNSLIVYHLRWKISRLAQEAPEEIGAVKKRFARDLSQRIRSSGDAALTQRLSRAARDILSADVTLEPPIEKVVADSKQERAR